MSIYWVKDTVAADAVGTVDTFSDPFGIQKAFDLATNVAPDEIRIVVGANNYNSSSTSWTNRDDSTFTINVDINTGLIGSMIKVSGYTDESTEGQATLDFDSASITGSNGFSVTGAVDYLLWKNIRVTDCDTDGWDFASGAQGHVFYLCRADNNGVYGIHSIHVFNRFFVCQFDNNSSDGVLTLSGLIFCEANNNTADGQGTGADTVTHVCSVFDGNGVLGSFHDDNVSYINCTFEDNANGLSVSSGASQTIVVNCGFTNNTNYGIGGGGSGFIPLELNCGYFGNGTAPTDIAGIGLQIDRATTDPQYTNAASRDYSLGTNWKAAGEGGFFSGDMIGYIDIGAVQRQEAGGGILIHPGMSGGLNA